MKVYDIFLFTVGTVIGIVIGCVLSINLSYSSWIYIICTVTPCMSCIFYWYRIIIYRYYEYILKGINIVKLMMGKDIDTDDTFTYEKNHYVAKITYRRFNKKYNVYIPYDKEKSSNKQIKVFAKIPTEILDLDSQKKYEMKEITQQQYYQVDIQKEV